MSSSDRTQTPDGDRSRQTRGEHSARNGRTADGGTTSSDRVEGVTQSPIESLPPGDAPRLEVITGSSGGKTVTLGHGTVTIGRGEEVDLVIDDPRASRKHFEIVQDDDGYVLVDHSKFGTLVNGDRVSRHRLDNGDEIRVGETTARYVAPDASADQTLGPSSAGRADLTVPHSAPAAVPDSTPGGRAPGGAGGDGSRLILMAICAGALIVAGAIWLAGRTVGVRPQPQRKDSTPAPTERAGDVPSSPDLVIKGCERLLNDTSERRFMVAPDALPRMIRDLRATRASLLETKALSPERELASARIDQLLVDAEAKQKEFADRFARRALSHLSRSEPRRAKVYFRLVKAILGNPRDPAYVQAEKALVALKALE